MSVNMNLDININVNWYLSAKKFMNECGAINININMIVTMIMMYEYVCE